MKEEHVEQ